MGRLGGAEWLILILLVVVLFGAKRLPDVARGLGRSLRIFKAETKGLIDDNAEEAPQVGSVPPAPAASAAPIPESPRAEVRNETPPAGK